MLRLSSLRTLLAAMAVLLPILSTAQLRTIRQYMNARENGGNLGVFQRYQVGYSLPMASATWMHDLSCQTPDGLIKDTSIVKNMGAAKGWGATSGTHFPIAVMGEKSILAIPVDAIVNLYVWNTGDIAINGGTYNYDVATMQIGVPVGIDYKTGGDAMLDKSNRISFTAGIGMHPNMYATAFGPWNGQAKFRVQPYLKAELGVFAGICFKVRALYTMSDVDLIKANEEQLYGGWSAADESETIRVRSKPNLTLSLLVMPFSWDWKQSQWW